MKKFRDSSDTSPERSSSDQPWSLSLPKKRESGERGFKPRSEGGYKPRSEGGYKPRSEGGFRSRDEGGFKPRGEGGFKPRGEGGFKPRGEGGFKPRGEGGFKPRGEGGFKPRGEGGFRPRDDSGGFKPRGEGGFRPRDDAGGFKPRGEGGFRPRDDAGGFKPRGEGGFRPRDDGGGFKPRGEGGFRSRDDGGGFKPRGEGGFRSRDDGGGFKPRGEGGFRPRDDGGFKPRGEGGFRPRDDGGGFKPRGEDGYRSRDDGGGFKPRGEGGYRSRDDGGGFKPRGEGGFRSRDDGGGFKPRGEGGFKPRGEGFRQRDESGFRPRRDDLTPRASVRQDPSGAQVWRHQEAQAAMAPSGVFESIDNEAGQEEGLDLAAQRREEYRICGLQACLRVFRQRANGVRKLWFTSEQRSQLGEVLTWCSEQRVGYREVPADELERVSGSSHHEGVCMAIERPEWPEFGDWLKAVDADRASLVLLLDGVVNPHNLGALLRSAAHFAVDAVLLTPQSAGLSGAVYRTAEGGAEAQPLLTLPGLTALAELSAAGYRLIACDSSAEKSALLAGSLPERAVLVMGAEQDGVSPAVRVMCDDALVIPGSGAVESLNVAAAGAVMLALWRQQRL